MNIAGIKERRIRTHVQMRRIYLNNLAVESIISITNLGSVRG